MMLWRARLLDARSGRIVQSDVIAPSAAEARRLIEADGHVPIAVVARRASGITLRARFDLRSFCLEFKALLNAGLGIVGSLEALAEAQTSSSHRAGLQTVLELVRSGKALSRSMESAPQLFPPIFRAAMSAGEASGTLGDSLERFAGYLASTERLRQTIISASVYPAVVTVFGAVVVFFLVVFVLPRFSSAYEALPYASASAAGVLLRGSLVISQHVEVALAGLLLVSWFVWRYVGSDRGRLHAWRVAQLAAPVAEAVRGYWMARLFRTVAMMLRGGYTALQALKLGREVLARTPWVTAIDAAAEEIAVGKPFATAFVNAGLVQGVTSRLISAGDASSDLAGMLLHAAEYHERRLAMFVESLARVLEPCMLVLVAGVVGVIVLMMYMPIFELASTLR